MLPLLLLVAIALPDKSKADEMILSPMMGCLKRFFKRQAKPCLYGCFGRQGSYLIQLVINRLPALPARQASVVPMKNYVDFGTKSYWFYFGIPSQ
jgi:hypothetical protein